MSNTTERSHDELAQSLRTLDMKSTVDNFIKHQNQANFGPLSQLIDTIHSPDKIEQFVKELIGTIANQSFRDKIMNALKDHIKRSPWQTGFFIAGVVLIMNPLSIIGFGALGPVAGSAAAAWQSSMGSVAAGSAFTVLQRWGMVYAVPLAIVGGLLVVAAGVGAALEQPVVKEAIGQTVGGACFAGEQVDKWAKGEYGSPVADAVGHAGSEVDRWGKGEYGTPVADAAGHVANEVGKWAHGAGQWFGGFGRW